MSAAAAGAAAALSAPGCTTHQCDAVSVCIDLAGNECNTHVPVQNYRPSSYVSGTELVWESSPVTGPWIEYLGQHTYSFVLPDAFRAATSPDIRVFTSPDNPADAAEPHANSALAAGELSELLYPQGPATFSVLNATCANYVARIVVRAHFDGGSAD